MLRFVLARFVGLALDFVSETSGEGMYRLVIFPWHGPLQCPYSVKKLFQQGRPRHGDPV